MSVNKSSDLTDAATIRLAIACVIANESTTIISFVLQILEVCKALKEVKFIAVFDKTDKDGTYEIVKKMAEEDSRILVIYDEESKNVVEAIVTAYRAALTTQYEWILEINAGFRHQPRDLFKFIPYMTNGYDCIFGSRFMTDGSMKAPSMLRSIYSKGGTLLANLTLGTKLTDMTSGFQVIKREVAIYIFDQEILSKYHFINTEMKFYCKDFKTIEVPIVYETKAANLKIVALLDAFLNLYRLIVIRIQRVIQFKGN